MEKMGHGARPVREGEMGRREKNRLAAGNWTKRDKGIEKRVSNFQKLRFKRNPIKFK
jgi:hypothetical protein